MPLNVGQLFASLQLNTQQFFNSLNQAQAGLRSLGSAMTSMGMKMTAAVTLPLVGLGYAAIKSASDLNENMNKAKEVFKENSQEVLDWSNTTLKGIGMAKSSALDMASLFGDMGTSMGLTTKQSADMSKSLVELGGDMASFKNIGFDQVQTALNGIFTGETESLKMLGIVMTEANLQEFMMAKNLKVKIADMTQAEKVQLRYAFVMDKTRNAQGDFARTSSGAANQMRIFQESLKETSASFGQIMLPMFTKILNKINDMIQAFGRLDPKTQETIIKWALFAAVLGPVLVVLGSILSAISSLITVMTALSGITLAGAGAFLGWTLAVVAAIAVGTALGLLAVIVQDNWEKVQMFFITFGLTIYKIFEGVNNTINYFMGKAVIDVADKMGKMASMMPNIPGFTGLKDNMSALSEGLKNSINIEGLADKTVQSFKDIITASMMYKQATDNLGKGMLDSATDIYDELKAMFSLDNILNVDKLTGGKLDSTAKDLAKTISDALSGITGKAGLGGEKDKLINQMDQIIDKVKQMADTFRNSLGGLFDKLTPSKKISAKKLLLLETARAKMMEEFTSTMESLGGRIGFGSELFRELLKAGPSNLKSTRNILGMNETDLQQFSSTFNKRNDLSWRLGGLLAGSEMKQDKVLNNMSINLNGGVYVGNMQSLATMIVKELKAQSVY